MSSVFENAAAFDQDLSSWDITNISSLSSIFNNSGMSVASYDATLIGWAAQEVQDDVELGVEGLQYEMEDGEPKFTEAVLNSDEPVNSQLWAVGSQLQARGYFQDYKYEEQWSNEFALEGIALYDEGDYLIDQFLGVAFNADEQRIYDRYMGSLRDYMLERQQAWILGSGDVEADWDEYIEQLDKKGLQDILEVMNSAYERQYGS